MNKKLKLTILLMLALTLTLATTVQAALQSVRRGEIYQFKEGQNPVVEIRKMEEIAGGMGLSETIDTTTGNTRGLATSENNNIDVHMLKNTEYGAIILLGASDYGKQGTTIGERRMDAGSVSDVTKPMATTTGNK